jgi:mRNA-binding protein PUF3
MESIECLRPWVRLCGEGKLSASWYASQTRLSMHPVLIQRIENSTHADPIEGKTGSGSLVASSEKDQWNSNRSRWENTTTSIPHVRSSGVSPTRRRSVAQLEPSQHFSDNSSSTFFPISRQSAVGQSLVAQSTKPLLDPTSTNFTSARRIDTHTANGFANFGFGQADASSRPDASAGSWPDAASVHSPTDDRRSIVHSEYFGPSSTTASRNGSLPPSRHGNEPIHFGQTTDVYQRYAQSGQRQNASFSFANGRGSQERSGSIQSDIMPKYSRFGFEHDPDAGTMSHRPSISINNRFGSNYSPAVNGSSLAGDTYVDDGSYTNTGSFTPNMNNYGSGQVWEVDNLFRPVNFDSHSRSAPNGTGVRQSPHYSSAQTPANYDHLYPSGKIEQTLANSNNLAVVQHKLQGYQIQQERRNYLQPAQHYPYPFQFQQYMAANNERNYQLAYSMSNAMQIHIPPNMLSSVPGYLSIEPPKGPRNDAALSTMSQELSTFRNDIKNSRRIDLHQIYGHIVEFSGDQHGSRFIQGKLESANSDEKDKVFRELQEDCLQLMLDTFGNYVIQKFFEHGDQVQKRILATRMKGHIMTLSNNMYGCRVVQKVRALCLTACISLTQLGPGPCLDGPASLHGKRARGKCHEMRKRQ